VSPLPGIRHGILAFCALMPSFVVLSMFLAGDQDLVLSLFFSLFLAGHLVLV
jgi:hypothetical protein